MKSPIQVQQTDCPCILQGGPQSVPSKSLTAMTGEPHRTIPIQLPIPLEEGQHRAKPTFEPQQRQLIIEYGSNHETVVGKERLEPCIEQKPSTNQQPYDPNLACLKRFHIGEIQKFKHHVKNCDETDSDDQPQHLIQPQPQQQPQPLPEYGSNCETAIKTPEPHMEQKPISADQRPYDPNLICPMCMRQFRFGDIQKFKRHVNTCDGTDSSDSCDQPQHLIQPQPQQQPQPFPEYGSNCETAAKTPQPHMEQKPSADQRPYDPNLVCPMCMRRFRFGDIQKFRHHVKTCDGTDSTDSGDQPQHLIQPQPRQQPQPFPEYGSNCETAAKTPEPHIENKRSTNRRPYDPNLVCPVCIRQFHLGDIQKFKRHVNTCDGTVSDSTESDDPIDNI